MKNGLRETEAGKEPIYRVVSPLGRSTHPELPLAPPLRDFKGKRIGFVWNIFTNGDVLSDQFADLLAERYEAMRFVRLPSSRKGKWGEYPSDDFPDVVRESGVDAVIALVGG